MPWDLSSRDSPEAGKDIGHDQNTVASTMLEAESLCFVIQDLGNLTAISFANHLRIF